MSSEYDTITASHYAAYRPVLHEIILKKCINENEEYALGLDIGCGTGHSSIALSKFCKKVTAIDPSNSMIEKAIGHPKVEYRILNTNTLEFESSMFDLVTLGGSLHYAKSQKLLDEVLRVLKNKGLIVVYDFEILLGEILSELAFTNQEEGSYDHEADFSGLRQDSISLVQKEKETLQIEISPTNLAHLILSVKTQYLFFKKQFEQENLHHRLSESLSAKQDSKTIKIEANLYHKVYSILK